MPGEPCIRCGNAPSVDDLGYCGHCHWAARAELEEGLVAIGRYLACWGAFFAWLRARGLEP